MFREVQYCSWWVYGLLLGIGLVLARAYRVSGRVLPLGFIALIVILTALFLRLETVVSEQELAVSFGWLPVVRKRMPLTEITRVEASSYRPLRDFGGWGWRFGPGGVQALTAKGTAGVFLWLRDGQRYLVGSARSDELAQALRHGAPAP
jgi:hypothetical protein